MSETHSISELPNHSVYKRVNGELYMKLNSQFHVKTRLTEDEQVWQGDGTCEKLNPTEVVETIDRSPVTQI